MPGGEVRMIHVGEKDVTQRVARARARVRLSPETLQKIVDGKVPKGDVLTVSRVAGIQAAKDTSRLLPLCHPLPLESVDVAFEFHREGSEIEVLTTARATWKTGVEMEALAAASAAALCIYDMCKMLERGISIHHLELLEKSGGKSGPWTRST